MRYLALLVCMACNMARSTGPRCRRPISRQRRRPISRRPISGSRSATCPRRRMIFRLISRPRSISVPPPICRKCRITVTAPSRNMPAGSTARTPAWCAGRAAPAIRSRGTIAIRARSIAGQSSSGLSVGARPATRTIGPFSSKRIDSFKDPCAKPASWIGCSAARTIFFAISSSAPLVPAMAS
jgi:hypothetical protein